MATRTASCQSCAVPVSSSAAVIAWAIHDHEDPNDPSTLHLFLAERTELEYLGQFRYHDHYQADTPEVDDGPIRKVIVFRLKRIAGTRNGPKRARLDRLGYDRVREVPVEQDLTESTLIEGRTE